MGASPTGTAILTLLLALGPERPRTEFWFDYLQAVGPQESHI